MVVYKPPKKWNGHSLDMLMEKVCRGCDNKESKETGIWRSPVGSYEREESLKTEKGYGILVRKNGSNGEMVARVPLEESEVREIHRDLSQIQAKQRMETCDYCEATLRKIFKGEIPVDGFFEVV